MRKVRQRADRPSSEKTSDAPTLSEMNRDPVAFNPNQISVLVLPLVSDTKRLIWVHANQVDLQPECVAELEKAFDRFPYLTQNQTAALAQRCSVHPDQVKVWFMVQRLRYGISWDYKDILQVQKKMKPSGGKEELQKDTGENNKLEKEVKAGEVREEQSGNEGRMMSENVRAVKKERDREVEKPHEDKRNTTVTEEMGKKRRADEGVAERAEEVQITSDEVKTESTKSTPIQLEKTGFTRKKKKKAKANNRLPSVKEWPAQKSIVVPDETLDVRPQTQACDGPPLQNICRTPMKSGVEKKTEMEAKLRGEPHAASTNLSGYIADVVKVKQLIEVNNNLVLADGCSPIHCNTKRKTQLAMMKMAFSHCQYPDSADYERLAILIGVPRYMLVQWFGDMRYHVKKRKPHWMNKQQHSQALANIKYRQWLIALARMQQSKGNSEKASRKMKVDKSESCDEDKGVQGPPE